MCGLTGFWNRKQRNRSELLDIARKMADTLDNRGPDSFGVWCDENAGIAFGHRRLAVVDLSEAGHQPMLSRSGACVIAYNGEIYNAPDIRDELIKSGYEFRGLSDTEVIVEACEAWGVEATAQKLIGMFAFALWDKRQQQLFLVRDRLGIKPLYWGYQAETLFFGSQPKSFRPHPDWRGELDPNTLASYFRFNYVPTPLSIFKNMHQLSPGSILMIDAAGNKKESRFWDFQNVLQQCLAKKNDHELVDELEILLKDAVKRRMVADVPLGAFLSGGIDSSLVVALMQAQSTRPVETFSIGFHEEGYDEAKYAALVAKTLQTSHQELYLSSQDACRIIPGISTWCDEPFADVSQIPTFLVSKMAREKVTVSLSGDGGDELFGGYSRYFLGQRIWQKISLLPFWLRRMIAASIQLPSPKYWDCMAGMIPKAIRPNLLADKLYKLSSVLTSLHPNDFYKGVGT